MTSRMTLQMLGITAVPLFVRPDTGFQPTVGSCRKLVTPKTKALALVLVSSNNPVSIRFDPA